MTSRCSDNLYALITFQGQESWMQVQGSFCRRSHDGRKVFSTKLKLSCLSKLAIMAHLAG